VVPTFFALASPALTLRSSRGGVDRRSEQTAPRSSKEETWETESRSEVARVMREVAVYVLPEPVCP
jgi:hypothetical protein